MNPIKRLGYWYTRFVTIPWKLGMARAWQEYLDQQPQWPMPMPHAAEEAVPPPQQYVGVRIH